VNGAAAPVGGLEIVKKDNLQRRRSHLSMYEIELTVRTTFWEWGVGIEIRLECRCLQKYFHI